MSSTYSYKIVLLGESSVGKSSISIRFSKDQFSEFQESTIGAAFLTKTMTQSDGDSIRFEIWDTAGQERYHSLAPMYYRGAKASMVVYSITSTESFERAKLWVSELKQNCDNMLICLMGNKSDLEYSRNVTIEEASEYAQKEGLLFFEVSAKTGANINDSFHAISDRLPRENTDKARTFSNLTPVSNKKRCC